MREPIYRDWMTSEQAYDLLITGHFYREESLYKFIEEAKGIHLIYKSFGKFDRLRKDYVHYTELKVGDTTKNIIVRGHGMTGYWARETTIEARRVSYDSTT